MSPLKKFLFVPAFASLVFTLTAGAATLTVNNSTTVTPGGSVNFGRTGGTYLLFSGTGQTASSTLNWAGSPPVDSQVYSLDSVAFTKNVVGPATSPAELWVGVYTSFTGGVLGGFQGASSSSVAWASAASGSTLTWNFNGIEVAAAPAQELYLMFQTSAASRDGLGALGLSAEGDISTLRLADTGTTNGGPHTFAGQGVAIIQDNNAVRADRVPHISVQITPVPEPSAVGLLGLGALCTLRRRRR
jgi:hypothetical protein